MKHLFFYSNCHAQGLSAFLKLNRAFNREFTISYEQNFMVQLGHTPIQKVIDGWSRADVILYHWLDLRTPHVIHIPTLMEHSKDGTVHVAMSNPQNFGYFCSPTFWTPALQSEVRERVAKDGIDFAINYYWESGDLEWEHRYNGCLTRMKEKERDENVPSELRISELFDEVGLDNRLLLVANHPSSFLFYRWAQRLSDSLGVGWHGPSEDEMLHLCNEQPNYANLPCVDWIIPSARKHLGLRFPEDDSKSKIAAANAITEFIATQPPTNP